MENICGRDLLAQFTIDNIGDFSGESNNEIAEGFYLFQGEKARIEFEKIKESILFDARKHQALNVFSQYSLRRSDAIDRFEIGRASCRERV